MNKKIIGSAVAAVLIIGGFLIYKNKNTTKNLNLPVVQGPVVDAVYGIGKIVSAKTYEYKVGVTTQITNLYVSEGVQVNKDQRLLTLETGGILVAPFAGTITGLYYQKGENIAPGTNVLTVTDLKDRYLVVTLEQQGALKVRPDQKVKISFESLREQSIEAKVTSIYSNAQREFAVRIDTPNLPLAILPGMTADVAIVIQEKGNAILVPVSGIKESAVTRIRDGKKEIIAVKTGLVDGEMAEITDGDLKVGDQVQVSQGI